MQRKPHKTSFDYLINSDHTSLQHIIGKVHQLKSLNELVMGVLDKKYHDHCYVCNLRDGILVLGVDSSTWMTPLRFESSELLSNLRKIPALAGIIKIELKVQLPVVTPQEAPPGRTVAPLTPNIARFYQKLAQSCDEPALKAVLFRIAAHN